MFSVARILLLVCFTVANAQLDKVINIDFPFKITPVSYLRSHFLQPYSVYGAKDCGYKANVSQFVHNGCVPANPAVTCLWEVNRKSQGYVYFVAGEDASDLLVRATIIDDGQPKSVTVPVPHASLQAGQSYALDAVGTIQQELLGKFFTGRLEVLRKSDNSVQVCSEIDFLGYKE